jgi:hypothetical protein
MTGRVREIAAGVAAVDARIPGGRSDPRTPASAVRPSNFNIHFVLQSNHRGLEYGGKTRVT